MSKGIILGILMQFISALGYLIVVNVASIKNEWFRTGLMICCAGVVAICVAAYMVFTGQQQLSAILPKEYILIAISSILVMFVAQLLFFWGIKASNMTTMALTLLAFPFIILILEIAVGRMELSSLGAREILGFALIAGGYIVYASKPAAG